MQELFDDISAIRRGIEALSKRAQEQGKPMSRAELDDALARVQAVVKAQAQPNITLDSERVAQRIQGHMATPAAIGEVLRNGTAQLKVVMDSAPRTLTVEGEVHGFTSWKAAALVVAVTVLVLLVGEAVGGMFSQVSQEKYDRLQLDAMAIESQRDYYKAQIQTFRKQMDANKADHQMTEYFFPPLPSTVVEK